MKKQKFECPYQPHMIDTIQPNKRTTERSNQKFIYIHAKNNRDGSTLITIEKATFTRHPNHNQTYLICHFASVKVVVDWPVQRAFRVKPTKKFLHSFCDFYYRSRFRSISGLNRLCQSTTVFIGLLFRRPSAQYASNH